MSSGQLAAYGLMAPQKVLVPCLNAKTCGHHHPEPEIEDDEFDIWELAEDAIDSLADVLDDIAGGVKDYSGHQEQLAYLKQALKEAKES